MRISVEIKAINELGMNETFFTSFQFMFYPRVTRKHVKRCVENWCKQSNYNLVKFSIIK